MIETRAIGCRGCEHRDYPRCREGCERLAEAEAEREAKRKYLKESVLDVYTRTRNTRLADQNWRKNKNYKK